MSLQVFVFLGSLVVVLGASELFGRGLDRLGSRLGLSDEVVGMLAALGADSPEIASSVVALLSGERDLGVGIVLGSNLFNLGVFTPAVSGFLLLLVVLPYLYVLVSGRSNLEFLPMPARWKRFWRLPAKMPGLKAPASGSRIVTSATIRIGAAGNPGNQSS